MHPPLHHITTPPARILHEIKRRNHAAMVIQRQYRRTLAVKVVSAMAAQVGCVSLLLQRRTTPHPPHRLICRTGLRNIMPVLKPGGLRTRAHGYGARQHIPQGSFIRVHVTISPGCERTPAPYLPHVLMLQVLWKRTLASGGFYYYNTSTGVSTSTRPRYLLAMHDGGLPSVPCPFNGSLAQ